MFMSNFIKSYIKAIVPAVFKRLPKQLIFYKKYGFFPPPAFTDLSGYELLLDVIIQQKIYQLEGDFVEKSGIKRLLK